MNRGPATASGDEPATAILAGVEAPTRQLMQTTDADAIFSKTDKSVPNTLQRKANVSKALVAAVAVVAVVGIGFGIYKYSGGGPINISFESAKITKVTDSGKAGNVAISPDGKWLIYSIYDGGKSSLWLKQVAIGDSNTQIVPPADVNYRGLAFSPDGN